MLERKKAIWLTYDFGLKGDYTGLFTWLDNHNAVECGSGIAFFKFESSAIKYSDTLEELKNELTDSIQLSKTDRLYAIIRDEETNLIKGKFISGGRRESPWQGYGKIRNNDYADTE